MHRADGAGVTVVRHACNLAQPCFVKSGVGKYHANRCIVDEFILLYVDFFQHQLFGVQESLAIVCPQTRDLAAVFVVINVACRVHGHNRTDFQRADLHGITADAGFHAVVHAQQLAHSRAGARTIVAVAIVAAVLGIGTGLVRHGGIGPGAGIRHGQIEEVCLTDKWHFRHTYVITDIAFFQIAHHAARGVQSERAAPRQHNGVDDLRRRQRFEQLALPRSRPAAANIQSRRGTVFAQQEHRAPGPRCCVLCLADLEIVKGCDGNFFHGRACFALLFYCTSSAPATQHKFPPGGHPAGRGIIQPRGRGALFVIFMLIYRLFFGIFLRTVYGIVCFPVPMESNGSHFFIHLRVKPCCSATSSTSPVFL